MPVQTVRMNGLDAAERIRGTHKRNIRAHATQTAFRLRHNRRLQRHRIVTEVLARCSVPEILTRVSDLRYIELVTIKTQASVHIEAFIWLPFIAERYIAKLWSDFVYAGLIAGKRHTPRGALRTCWSRNRIRAPTGAG